MAALDISLPLANALHTAFNVALILGAVLSVIGTVGTIWTGGLRDRYAEDRASENELATAKANSEAASARLETQKLASAMAWRRLTDAQRGALAYKLKGKKFSVWTSFVGSDPEATLYRNEIDEALKQAGIETKYFSGWEVAVGLQIVGPDTPEHHMLIDAFRTAGMPFSSGRPTGTFSPNEQVIIVGTKPEAF